MHAPKGYASLSLWLLGAWGFFPRFAACIFTEIYINDLSTITSRSVYTGGAA